MARDKKSYRKKETRRKIFVSSYYLDQVIKEYKFNEIEKIMDGYLTWENDRKLFDLSLVK